MALKVGRGAAAPPFIVMDVIAAANARAAALGPGDPRVIRMEVGQPSTGAPAGAVEAAIAAMRAGETLGYTEAFGTRPLRERIARLYAERYGVAVDPRRIAVTIGASGAFPLAFLAAFDPGDRVALASPFYPPYVNILTALGLRPVIVEAGVESRFQPTVAMLERLDPLPEGLIVASPCNPAGTMLHRDELAALAAWCEAKGVRLISDEIYHGLTYGAEAATAAALSSSAVVINSFSKYWSMTGWRIGWMVLPDDLVRPVECLAQNLVISAPGIAQVAALAAMDCGAELDGHVARYAANRALLIEALPKAGLGTLAPAEGAFYLYADVGHLTNDSAAFCARMLAEIGVAATPGVDFDRTRGARTVRFSFCGATEDMAEAAARLTRWLAR
jgi:aspartate/methionine/tyrosine aminotransferase